VLKLHDDGFCKAESNSERRTMWAAPALQDLFVYRDNCIIGTTNNLLGNNATPNNYFVEKGLQSFLIDSTTI
jgi:hypothetical protein